MIFRVLTIFPDFFRGILEHGVLSRAIQSGVIAVHTHNLRDWATDRHKTVDDRPFGGGEGMLLKPEPVFSAVESIWPERTKRQRLILLSAQGRLFDQEAARSLARYEELMFICGRYEGVDERERGADETEAANRIMQAIEALTAEGTVLTPDLGGTATTEQVAERIIELL
jgi:tRNA (guanine37-N1)-methyltransferase